MPWKLHRCLWHSEKDGMSIMLAAGSCQHLGFWGLGNGLSPCPWYLQLQSERDGKVAKERKTDNTKCRQGCGATRTLLPFGGSKLCYKHFGKLLAMATRSGPVTQLLRSWVYTQQKCNQTFIQRHKTRMLVVASLILDTEWELLQCPSIAHGEVNDSTFLQQAMPQR